MSLRARILGTFVCLIAVAIAVVVLVEDSRQKAKLLDLEKNRGTAIARSLAAATSTPLLTYNYVSLQQLAERAVADEGVEYVIILDKEGAVAGYSGHPQRQGEHLTDPVSEKAFSSDETIVQEVPDLCAGHGAGIDIAVPVFVEGSQLRWGMVRVGLSLEPMFAEVVRTRGLAVGSGFIVLALASLVSGVLSRQITKPLKRLVEATEELAKGNFNYRVGLKSGDEIGNLSQKFDAMSAIIRQKQLQVEETNAELADLNAGLEQKVRERTQALMDAEEKYRLLVEESPNPICIIQDGRLRFFNQAFANTFGYAEEELGARDWSFSEFLEENEWAKLDQMLAARRNDDDMGFYREIGGRRADGTPISLDMRSIWVNYDGAPALEAILVDVTEQKEVHERVVSNERLRALGEMASGVAHDFNNILGVILARAQLLQRLDISDEVARGLRIIEKAAQDGGASVRRIQEFSRVRKDREFRTLDLNSVIEDTVEMTRNQWKNEAHRRSKDIEVVCDLGEISRIEGNTSEMRELFTNLILNAVDAIEGRGTITIATRMERSRVEVTLADTGRGMPETVKRKLFNPFFSTKGNQGTGLGLSIAYGTVQRHGGDIEVQSEENSGTSFRISFPVTQAERKDPSRGPDPETSTPASAMLRGTGSILVVDDEDEILNLVVEVLEEGGYTVAHADGGEKAVRLFREQRFDLVVTDLGMPGMTGWDVARCCREIRSDIPIILLSGWGAVLNTEEARREGIHWILKKPFDMDDLLRTVHEALRVGGGQAAA